METRYEKTGHIIFLNGPSSAGKTSIARVLQRHLSDPYLHMALDTFLGMFPSSFVQTAGGSGEIPSASDGDAAIAIYLTPVARRLISGYHHAIAACALAGNNLIVDHVLLERQWLEECVALLANIAVFFVGIHCPLQMLEARERARGDRTAGLARAQFDRVHAHRLYDLEVDSSLSSAQACATRVVQALQHPPTRSAFQQLRLALRAE